MAVVWPVTLPQEQFMGLTEKLDPNTVDVQVASGPPISRRRSTRARREFSTPMMLTGVQVETLMVFFRTSLKDGIDSFEWTDFRTGATILFRFLAPPAFRLVIAASDPEKRRYDTEISVEEVFW
jgi:hypothetical protein